MMHVLGPFEALRRRAASAPIFPLLGLESLLIPVSGTCLQSAREGTAGVLYSLCLHGVENLDRQIKHPST